MKETHFEVSKTFAKVGHFHKCLKLQKLCYEFQRRQTERKKVRNVEIFRETKRNQYAIRGLELRVRSKSIDLTKFFVKFAQQCGKA